MAIMNKLAQLRTIIASLDETLVKALCGRAAFKVNAELYNELKRPLSVAETANLFGAASTIAGRVHIVRPFYVNTLLPALCEAGGDEDRRKCIAADANSMNALVQRLNLSVHVAALKLEEIPEALRRKAFEHADLLRWVGPNTEFLAEMRIKADQNGIPFDTYRAAVNTPARTRDIGPASEAKAA